MPYLTLGTYPRVDSDCNTDRSDKFEESISNYNSRQIKHKSMTLDQYYYPTIANSDERDNDQVLSKFLNEKDGLGRKKILLVNQIWIWIIDESMAIGINKYRQVSKLTHPRNNYQRYDRGFGTHEEFVPEYSEQYSIWRDQKSV